MKASFRIGLLALASLLFSCTQTPQSLTAYVDPFIGTGGHGHTFPGATLPFGMVQLSPDGRTEGWDWCSGYHYSDESLLGFSHTHLSGTGIGDYGDILFVPQTGEVNPIPGTVEDPDAGYRSRFSHENEEAGPGYYRVFLSDPGIEAELTATTRCGAHRYSYPKNEEASLLIDLAHGINDRPEELMIRKVSDTEVEGYRISNGWARRQTVYFAARFNTPMQEFGIFENDQKTTDTEKTGRNIKGYMTFGKLEQPLEIQVALSPTGTEGAWLNLESELPEFAFETVRDRAAQKWEAALSAIEVEGDKDEMTKFYTALYHTMIAPNTYTDADGSYRGHDGEIHQIEEGNYYTVFSLWDTYRALHPLYTLIDPARVNEWINTFLLQYRQGGRLPVWELAANETDCMIGYHSVSVIADAYMKGIRNYDAGLALEAMVHSATLNHFGLASYKAKQYIPLTEESESVSKTLEYAYDDWAIAQMAAEMGEEEIHKTFLKRGQYYKNLYDPESGFMRAKANEGWFSPFDPREVNFNYTEANSWQYSFYVPQDVSGLVALSGGEQTFVEKLDRLFSESSETSGRQQADITGLIGQYAHGNEPSHHMAYLYNYLGQPWKTQERVREIMRDLYTIQPDGYSGNEDCGQMSAWYVMSAMGLYAVAPGSPVYLLGSPAFEKVTLHLPDGKEFVIEAKGNSRENIYIAGASLNGENLPKSFLNHVDITAGGTLQLEMTNEANNGWATAPEHRPVSAITKERIHPLPYFEAGDKVFEDSTELRLACAMTDASIYYTTDGRLPDRQSTVYTEPLEISKTTTVRAFAESEEPGQSAYIEAQFKKIPGGRSLQLLSEYQPQYAAGGDKALIDQIRGNTNFRTGAWQGYEGTDLEAIVDLGSVQQFNYIDIGFLQDEGSWIFMPEKVEFQISEDGKTYRPVARIQNEIDPKTGGSLIRNFEKSGYFRGRYIKVKAISPKVCPDWHRGAGNPCWIFADEIVVQ